MKSGGLSASVLCIDLSRRPHTVLVEEYDIATGKVDSVSSAETGNYTFAVSLNALSRLES